MSYSTRVPVAFHRGWSWCLLFVLPLASLSGCKKSGSNVFDVSGELTSVTFPDPFDINPEEQSAPPAAAPLVQQVVYEFTRRPNPALVGPDSLPVLDAAGVQVPGTYQTDFTVVTFTPALPLRAPELQSDGSLDSGGAGMMPGSAYTLLISEARFAFLGGIDDDLRDGFPDPDDANGLRIDFSTTSVEEDFFQAIAQNPPVLQFTTPVDGATGVSPQLYTDPDGLFAPGEGFLFHFDGPVSPYPDNFRDFKLVDLDDPAGPAGLELATVIEVVSNELDSAVVRVSPGGILALVHLHTLEAPVGFDALHTRDPDPLGSFVVSTFTTATTTVDPIKDVVPEGFDDARSRVPDAEIAGLGFEPADWDENDSDLLQAASAFVGDGSIGRFIPYPPADPEEPRQVVLDTGVQPFPLLDGSTPDADPGTLVIGGVFEFTDIDIPHGVELLVRGANPLVLRATGTVRIAGKILLAGGDGTGEVAFDSAVASLPGGHGVGGGGRGGEGHPILYFPPDQMNNSSLVSPPSGGRGWGFLNQERLGGSGGQCGLLDNRDGNGDYTTDQEIQCSELTSSHSNGYKVPGGGGGTLLEPGTNPKRHGFGNVIVDGLGGYIVREDDQPQFDRLERGEPGDGVFVDADPANDFIGPTGELKDTVGGQGGGSGATSVQSYYCGAWCLLDADPTNDALCAAEFGNPPAFADSVGDGRGGAGGAGGGALVIDALEEILIENTAALLCRGGDGGGGEALTCGNWAGCGAGGSGGSALLQSGTGITVRAGATIDVRGGAGKLAVSTTDYITSCGGRSENSRGSGGHGGHGIIQLRVPRGAVALVEDTNDLTQNAWVDPQNQANPAVFDGSSLAITRWFDMGRTIDRGAPGTNPTFAFRGLDAGGQVITDAQGFVINPALVDIHCFWPGIIDEGYGDGRFQVGDEPREDWIPPNATVTLAFQGGMAITEGSSEVDPASLTAWAPDPAIAAGMQFIRTRITFALTGGPSGEPLDEDSRRPGVQDLGILSEF